MPIPRFAIALLALPLVAGLLIAQPPAGVQPPDEKDRMIVQNVAQILQYAHFKQFRVDEEMSKRTFKRFLDDFDPRKLFFLESDVAEFSPKSTQLHTDLLAGDVSFAYTVYKRYLQRVTERNAWAQELADAKYDFTKEDKVVVDFKTATYAKNEAESKARWTSWIKYELLGLIVDGVKEPEARDRIKKRYRNLLRFTRQLEKDELVERYLTALTASFDPHSSYMSPKTQEEFDIAFKLQLQGIGALLGSEDGRTTIKEIIPGGAAEKDKRLKPGDRITGVGQGENGEIVDVDEMKLSNVVKLIRGDAGTTVKLEVIPDGAAQRTIYVLQRQKVMLSEKEAKGEIIEVPRTASTAVLANGKGAPPSKAPVYRVGVVKLPSFYADNDAVRAGQADAKSATNDIRRILEDFNAKGVDAVVMDLRMNGGGLLHEAISITGLFIDEGPVVQVKDFKGNTRVHQDDAPGVAYNGPLVVLVNKFSASASEIFAAAIQDYKRGVVIGDSSTHGKGSVQQILDLGEKLMPRAAPNERNLGALKVTLQMFYRVNGDSTQNRGVVSDVVLPSITDQDRFSESKLDYALDFDRIAEAPHAVGGHVSPQVVEKLRKMSLERRGKSEDWAKLTKRVDRIRELANKKVITFNEALLKAQKKERDEEKAALADGEEDDDEAKPDPKKKKVEKKFGHDVYDREVLAIVGDYVRLQDGTLTSR